MNVKEKSRIQQQIFSKDYQQINNAKKYLFKYMSVEDETEISAEILLAKLFYEEGKYDLARDLLLTAESKDNSSKTIYYYLFKIYVKQNKFDSAYDELLIYRIMNAIDTIKMDLSIYELLTYILKISDINPLVLENKNDIKNTSLITTVKISNNELKKIYDDLINSINNANYELALIISDKCIEIAEKNKILIDFKIISDLLSKIAAKREKILATNKQNILNKLYQEEKNKQFDLLEEDLIKYLDILDVTTIMKLTMILIKNNYRKYSKQLLDAIIIKSKNMNNQEIEFIKKSINNDETLIEQEIDCYNLGKKHLEESNFPEAIKVFESGFYLNNNPIFLYYLGKTLYKENLYAQSQNLFLHYLEHGTLKSDKAYLYLSAIMLKMHKIKKHEKYVNQSNFVSKMLSNEIYIYSKNNILEEDNHNREKGIDNETLFENSLNNYDEIRQLYINGDIKKADRLLKELETKSDKTNADKKELSLIKKDKKLLINKFNNSN